MLCFDPRKTWLSSTGSPKSRIEDCKFENEKILSKLEFPSFDIVKEGPKKKLIKKGLDKKPIPRCRLK